LPLPCAVALLVAVAPALVAGPVAIIPQPASVTPQKGVFTLTAKTVIWTDAATSELGRRLARDLEPATGFPLAVRFGAGGTGSRVVFARDRRLARLGPEGYTLEVAPGRVTVPCVGTLCDRPSRRTGCT